MDKFNEIGFADWNKKSLDELVKHLQKEFGYQSTGTAKAIFELISYYEKTKHLHKPVVMQAEVSDGAKGAAVGNGAAGQSGSGRVYTDEEIQNIKDEIYQQAVDWLK